MNRIGIIFFKKLAIFFYLIHEQLNKVLKKMDQFVFTNLTPAQKKMVLKSADLKNKHTDIKRCFILACGPSINKQDLKKLEGEFCISVSNFFVHPDFKTIKPKYHVFAAKDPRMSHEHFGDWFKDYESHACGSEVLVSIADIDSVVKYKGLTKSNVHYYYSTSRLPSQLENNFDLAKPLPLVQTVANLAMYLAINIGIKEIYLVGFDHDMILNIGKSQHFYKEDANELTRAGYEEWVNDIDLEVLGGYYKNMWLVYKDLKKYANTSGIKIVNITPNSLLDVFPRTTFDSIVNKKEVAH